ncbi:gamma-glutamyl hydrolase-like [Uranotaenia lowii]|uniref:gamma-glutamyl hydrolase-like n=1 Tax=Uranotaenia lowii TaxID=190385 RepID=UPI0024791D64|nr:gamma-glutamyl hydrolase-like [Uranotaenia lowii]
MTGKTCWLVLFGLLSLGGSESATVISSREAAAGSGNGGELNEEPIIGVLAQEMSYALANKYDEDFKSYIAASYVKFIEAAGARVVPIWINKTEEYYADILSKVNGVLFPGGATWFNQSDGYADAGYHIYKLAKKINADGSYFPIWGTCLGFELLTYVDAERDEHRAHCSSHNQGLPLDFKPNFRNSRMFSKLPGDVERILSKEPVTSNFHQFCVTEQNLTEYGLDKDWIVMSTNKDWNGLEFISTLEHKTFPFYGVQFHPEKNLYEWIRDRNISHTSNAIRAAQYFAQFFVDETRKSDHRFVSAEDIDRHVIYNFPATFTGLKKSSYEQCYLFEGNVHYGPQYPKDSAPKRGRKFRKNKKLNQQLGTPLPHSDKYD